MRQERPFILETTIVIFITAKSRSAVNINNSYPTRGWWIRSSVKRALPIRACRLHHSTEKELPRPEYRFPRKGAQRELELFSKNTKGNQSTLRSNVPFPSREYSCLCGDQYQTRCDIGRPLTCIYRLAFEKRVISHVHRDAILSILLIISRATSEQRKEENKSN